jgi:predicted RNase H-like HicB family nuclease
MRFAVVIEKGETSFGAYVPDLPAVSQQPKRKKKSCG